MAHRGGKRRRFTRLISTLALILSTLAWVTPPAHATTTTYSQTFTSGVLSASSAQGLAWDSFRASLTGTYDKIVMSSTNNSFSLSLVSSSFVPQIATALKNGGSGNWTIDGKVVSVGMCNGPELTVHTTNSTCSCPNTAGVFTLRPTIGNENWGGAGGATCGAATQTITLTFTIDAPSASTFNTSQTSPTNVATGGVISYSLVLTQSVSDLAAGDFQYGGTSTCNTPTVSGSGTTYTVTVTNCTAGNLVLQLKANSITGTQSGPSQLTSANTIIIDRTDPTITSASGPANTTYLPGNSISFTLNMSETVTVSGTPRLALTIGSTTRYANYASGNNSRALVFSYAVQTSLSDIDTDGIAVSTSLDLNSGSISDLATNTLSALTFSAPSLTSVLVAQKPGAPTIDSISATSNQLAIFFTPGTSNGSAITNYEYSTNNGTNWTTRSPIATTSPITITGLTNGTSYPVRIRAVNAAGSGDSSTAVSATPTAVIVAGGSNISITYGQSASSSQFTASGGTSPYTFTLSSTPSGVSISNGVVTASSSTPAGTYTPNVVATDSGSQSGTKQITISVAKASTSITIALPNSATNAALGGAVTITATVSRAGSVNFMLGGTTISGCGTAAAASTTATCSWTPNALGSVSLTATFTPTDSANFETSTTTTLSITVVNGVSTVTLSLAGGTVTPPKGQTINIIAAVDQAGRITFLIDGKRILGCNNKVANVGNVTCSWKPAIQKESTITARLVPTNNVYNPSTSSLNIRVVRRSGTR